jgi:hypothetical protein
MSDGDPRDAAAWEVLESAADMVMQRSRRFSLDEVCVELGIDPDRIRERAAQLREEDDDHD